MRAISDATEALRDDASWFARAHELRLMTVHVSGDLRGAALSILAGTEFHHDNPSPWVVLEDAHTSADSGWAQRTNRLVAHWEARREAFREQEGTELAAIEPPEDGSSATPAGFARVCRQLMDRVPSPMYGLVVVVAPSVLEDVDALGHELGLLLDVSDLAPLRVVWVLDEDAAAPALGRGRSAEVLHARCIADPAQTSADAHALLAGGMAPGARPTVPPPRRADDPPPLPKEERDRALTEAGISPAYVERAPELGTSLVGASVAMSEGRGDDALRLSREARDVAAALGMPSLVAITQVTLASYQSALGRPEDAVAELETAIRLANEHDLPREEAQARLALGLLHGQAQRWGPAAEQYAECARRAERAGGLGILAIEGWRLAGHVAIAADQPSTAAECFREALRVAEWTPPDEVAASSAPEAARRLAHACREGGLLSQADSLEITATAMEAGEFGTPFDEAPTLERRSR